MNEAVRGARTTDPKRRAYWLKTLHQWHWISAAISLAAILMFSVTGLTLNHAGQIEAKPLVVTQSATVPKALLGSIGDDVPRKGSAPMPQPLADWLHGQWRIDASDKNAEWSDGEIYLSLPRPGGDAWVSIDTDSGEATWEVTDRGWVAWFNDLHKGRNTGALWGWFIDLFALACLLFSLTGLLLLWLHGRQRAMTWPMVGLGLLLPVLIALLFIH